MMTEFGEDSPSAEDIGQVDIACLCMNLEHPSTSPSPCLFLNFLIENEYRKSAIYDPKKFNGEPMFCDLFKKFAWNAVKECKGEEYIDRSRIFNVIVTYRGKIREGLNRGLDRAGSFTERSLRNILGLRV